MADTNPHGALFDRFSARATHAHGGSLFDGNFGPAAVNDAHGRLMDLFGVPRNAGEAHGQRFDEFGWHDMPAMHGQYFDTDFQAPSSGDGEHGSTWFDVFRGGRTQARVIVNGKDVEGVVIDCNRDFATVQDHAGQTHEVSLSQFLAYRTPNMDQAGVTAPPSDAHAPSAHSQDAHGGPRTDGPFDPSSLPTPVAEAPQGQYTEPRTHLNPDSLMGTFEYLKSKTLELDVAKSVDSTETAAQGSPAKTVGHRSNCPRGGSGPCGADVNGSCTLCGANVRDHEAVGKAFGAPADLLAGGATVTLDPQGQRPDSKQAIGDPPDVKVPEREHKTSDHHMQLGAKPSTCPHCGGALEQIDHATRQGHPSRAHKCVGTGLDVLKALA